MTLLICAHLTGLAKPWSVSHHACLLARLLAVRAIFCSVLIVSADNSATEFAKYGFV